MSLLLDIATAIPPYKVKGADLPEFYAKALGLKDADPFLHKVKFMNKKTRIETRYSCIPDFNGEGCELYKDGVYVRPVEERMKIFSEKAVPLASEAIMKVMEKTNITPPEITHFITVTCTGITAPGMELLLAEVFGLQHAEKTALNYLGCYAAMKALKLANQVCTADPEACVLLVCTELCSLHFYPSELDDDLVANLLFGDGSAAAIVCGEKNDNSRNRPGLKIESSGSVYIPGTFDLMTWSITSSAFKMHLDKHIAEVIRTNIREVFDTFTEEEPSSFDHWAIHPGGIKILEAVQEELELKPEQVCESFEVLRNYGNMSSGTVLFILKNIIEKIGKGNSPRPEKIMTCAFGPGINVEMIAFSAQNNLSLNTEPIRFALPHEFEI